MAEERMSTEYKDKSWLKEQYYEKGLSTAAMGKLCGVSPATIHHWMHKFKMRLRTATRAQELRLKRERLARADRILRSAFDCDDDLGDAVLAELDDERLFAGCPRLLELLRKRDVRKGQALSDAERRRAEIKRLERSRDTASLDYTAEDQMADIQGRFDKLSKLV
jgi:DNA-binding transcriptional MerR regulator